MTLDSFDIAKIMVPPPVTDGLKARYGTITALHIDGTADVLIDGSTMPQCLPNWSDGLVGSRCMVAMKGTDWLILSASVGSSIELTAVPVPVGGIYETMDSRNPAVIWPGTAWEALGPGRSTRGADGKSWVAGKYGGSDVLTTEQLPSHSHQGGYGSGSYLVPNGSYYGLRDRASTDAAGGNQPHYHPYIIVNRWKRLPNTGTVAEFNLQEISDLIKTTDLTYITSELQARLKYRRFAGSMVLSDTGTDGYMRLWTFAQADIEWKLPPGTAHKLTQAFSAGANCENGQIIINVTNGHWEAWNGWTTGIFTSPNGIYVGMDGIGNCRYFSGPKRINWTVLVPIEAYA